MEIGSKASQGAWGTSAFFTGTEALGGEGADGVAVYLIPRKALKLERQPFAQGGGGQIFKGRYMGNVVAAKQTFVNAEKMNAEERIEFDREVAMLTKLTHPCILSLYGISRDESALFMVMDFCGGGDLEGYHRTPAFTNAEYNRVVLEVLSGVAYLHEREIGHRDLKPANVFLEAGSYKVLC